jgi:hypothetical protein
MRLVCPDTAYLMPVRRYALFSYKQRWNLEKCCGDGES